MKKNIYRNGLCIFFLLNVCFIHAHGILSERIKEKTEEIHKNPKNAQLYYERGFLYQQHEELNKAIKDYKKSEKLGNSNKIIQYRKAQVYYHKNKYSKALKASKLCLKKDGKDVKINKLHAQILIQLNDYNEALKYYKYFIKNALDINPDDVIEYSSIYLAIDKTNYTQAIEIIEFGLNKLGENTFSLQLKKLDYLEASSLVKEAIEQYNYFIVSTDRKEFWYYKKAKYLSEQNKFDEAKIAIQQAKTAIVLLNEKFQNTSSIKILNTKINNLENKL